MFKFTSLIIWEYLIFIVRLKPFPAGGIPRSVRKLRRDSLRDHLSKTRIAEGLRAGLPSRSFAEAKAGGPGGTWDSESFLTLSKSGTVHVPLLNQARCY